MGYHGEQQDTTPPSAIVLCELSGTIRDRLLDYGWDAVSCDILPCESDNYGARHYQMDAFEALRTRSYWDMVIMHPPCTALAVSGNAHYGMGKAKYLERVEAIKWTMQLWVEACKLSPAVCLENPVGVLSNYLGKPAQYIQPWQFGHPESKKTGLWLHGLDPLKPTNVLPEPECGYWENQTPSGQNKLGPSKDRAKIRSKTYAGIADAIVDQWCQW